MVREFSGVPRVWKSRVPFVAAMAVLCGLLVAGCNDHVETFRDPDVRVAKHSTWAWRPVALERNPVKSRDEIRPPGPEDQARNEMVRGRIRVAIEREMSDKGFNRVEDPQAADFLVDYHIGIRNRTATVQRVYPGYPGFVCGPFGCWDSWGYGPPEVAYQNVRYREGTFIFDLERRSDDKLAYRAIGQREVGRGTFSQDYVSDAMHRLLKNLKAGK